MDINLLVQLITIMGSPYLKAHDYFFDTIAQFHAESGRMKMIKELSEMIKLFNKWDQLIEGIYLHIWQQRGLTEEVISRKIEQLKTESA